MIYIVKKIIAVVVAAAIALSFYSCSGSSQDEETTANDTAEETKAFDDDDNDNDNDEGDANVIVRDADNDGKQVVCIDPGHGFGDTGCTSQYISCYERDITLSVSKKLKEMLEDKGVTVLLTHDGEEYPNEKDIIKLADKYNIEYKEDKIVENDTFSAYERVIYENILDCEYGLDFFISLHVNAVENADYVNGFSIDYYENNPYHKLLEKFCSSSEETLKSEFNRDVKIFANSYDDSYVVTKYTDVPSVLLEMGYATNKEDAANVQSDKWQTQLSETLCDLICDNIFD